MSKTMKWVLGVAIAIALSWGIYYVYTISGEEKTEE